MFPIKYGEGHSVTFGADPELFIALGGRVIGAEKVIPETGLCLGADANDRVYPHLKPIVVLDGVQVELHPESNTCRQGFGISIRRCLHTLEGFLKRKDLPQRPCFVPMVEVDKEEFATLTPKSKALGCMPSFNLYGRQGIVVNPDTYRWRSAGGHIHLGFWPTFFPDWKQKRLDELVVLLDILLGNTCVLLDRDPLAARRRQTYGMAGEHRLPAHGLEYRTLSNFWLRSYQLTSFVLGVARQAVIIWYADKAAEVISLVDPLQVEKAINENDFSLAQENFNRVKGYLAANFPASSSHDHSFPLGAEKMIPKFEKVVARGLEEYFPQDPLRAWQNTGDTLIREGWEAWINESVKL